MDPPVPRGRHRRSAAERRRQKERSYALVCQRLLSDFDSLVNHRGSQRTKLANAVCLSLDSRRAQAGSGTSVFSPIPLSTTIARYEVPVLCSFVFTQTHFEAPPRVVAIDVQTDSPPLTDTWVQTASVALARQAAKPRYRQRRCRRGLRFWTPPNPGPQ